MVTIKTHRDALLNPLQAIAGAVERRHTLPILSNVLIQHHANQLALIATDLEIEIKAQASIAQFGDSAITVSARKLQDILRSFPDQQEIVLEPKDSRMLVRAGKSRFNLQVLPANDYPRLAAGEDGGQSIQVQQAVLRRLLTKTYFSMAQQDIRYYLNGMLFSVAGSTLRLVATDGHRLAMTSHGITGDSEARETIIPRKAIGELVKLLGDTEEPVHITLYANQAKFRFAQLELTTKLIEGKFPDYTKVIPSNYAKQFRLKRLDLLQALQRAAILSNDKIRGVRLTLTKDNLAISCTNAEQEEAQEDLAIAYAHDPLDIGFNLSYLIDILNHESSDEIDLAFGDASSSALITVPDDLEYKYVVMPMRI